MVVQREGAIEHELLGRCAEHAPAARDTERRARRPRDAAPARAASGGGRATIGRDPIRRPSRSARRAQLRACDGETPAREQRRAHVRAGRTMSFASRSAPPASISGRAAEDAFFSAARISAVLPPCCDRGGEEEEEEGEGEEDAPGPSRQGRPPRR